MPGAHLIMDIGSRAIGYGASGITIGGGLLAAGVPDPAYQQTGLGLAAVGVVTVVVNGGFGWLNRREDRIAKDSEARRQIQRERLAERASEAERKASEAERKAERLAARVTELEALTADIPANSGRARAALDVLKERGLIARPDASDAPPHTDWPTVLLVEDDPATITAMSTLLERHGFDAAAARTIPDAIAKLEERPSFVLLDLKLVEPGDGLAVLEAVQSLGLPTKVLVTTGSQDAAILKRAADLGATAVLRKPVPWPALMKVLQPSKSDDSIPVYRGPTKGGR